MITAILAAAALAGADGPVPDAARRLPRDVRTFVARRIECNHWGGEDPYDAERARQIRAAVERLRCGDLDRDEARLRRRHAASPAVLEALARARDEVW